MKRQKLAITAISGNEERWAKGWCESILKAKPDIVVMNLTQYDDDTEQIIRDNIPEELLVLVKFPWKKDFSEARNHYLDNVPDWVDYCFFVDMDEKITKESFPILEQFLHAEHEPVIALVNIYNSVDSSGESSQVASLYYPRLHPHKDRMGKPLGERFESHVHNQLIINKKHDIFPVRTQIGIFHYGYALDAKSMTKKHERSEELLRGQIKKDNNSFFAHLNLAQLLRAKGDFEGTVFHAEEVLRVVADKVNSGDSRYVHAWLMAKEQLATALLTLHRPDESIKHSKDTLGKKADYLDSFINLGNAYMEKREFEEAEFWYKRYLFIRSRYDEVRDNTNLILNHLNSGFVSYYQLGILSALKKDMQGAHDHFKKAFEVEPRFKDVSIKYLHSLRLLGDMEGMNKLTNQIMNELPDKGYQVYEYYGDSEMEHCNIEGAKFNYYQAVNLGKGKPEYSRINTKFQNIKDLFGEVSNNFFDDSAKGQELKQRVKT